MPNLRVAAVLIAGIGLATVSVLSLEPARLTIEAALDGHWHRAPARFWSLRRLVAAFGPHRPFDPTHAGPLATTTRQARNGPHDAGFPGGTATGRGGSMGQLFAGFPLPQVPTPFGVMPDAGPYGGGPLGAPVGGLPPGLELGPPSGPSLAVTDPEAPRVALGIELYRRGDLVGGDALAKDLTGPVGRLALAWAALRLRPVDAGLDRLEAFAADHPDWPAMAWLKRRIEEAAVADKVDPARREAVLRAGPPQTVAGKMALAGLERAAGHASAAAVTARQVWRAEDLTPYQEAAILRDFGDVIGRDDHKFRADRLLYKDGSSNKEPNQAVLREAALAGPDVVALMRARAALAANAPQADAALAAVPKALEHDPGLIFARIQRARRANRIGEAAALMVGAPREASDIVDGDEWWVERRIIARKLLDRGETRLAYRICAEHSAHAPAMKIEAEFHAGWIALRFLDDPRRALGHFAAVTALAETPISKSRAAYWRGRALEAAGEAAAAAGAYDEAARYSISFYGQLAAARIGRTDLALRAPAAAATGQARAPAVRVAELLFALGQRDIALPLALDIARFEPAETQVAALGDVVAKARDAWATLAVGKVATQRGLNLDEVAFPTFGIPPFQPLPNSADLATVYAIARQESEFDPKAASSAGAKGLMQMMSATARRTAERAGIAYDEARLGNDAAFNAQLGAAHLGALLDEQGGSYVLTFAAYNAGGKNVKDWIDAYGDPRKPGVDPVDWIERIPFTETRNYVQRVIENLAIYRMKLGQPAAVLIGDGAPPLGKGT